MAKIQSQFRTDNCKQHQKPQLQQRDLHKSVKTTKATTTAEEVFDALYYANANEKLQQHHEHEREREHEQNVVVIETKEQHAATATANAQQRIRMQREILQLTDYNYNSTNKKSNNNANKITQYTNVMLPHSNTSVSGTSSSTRSNSNSSSLYSFCSNRLYVLPSIIACIPTRSVKVNKLTATATTTTTATTTPTKTTVALDALDAATLELKERKVPYNKKLLVHVGHVAGNLDMRSLFYLTLLVLIYCCVLMHASAAASANSDEHAVTPQNQEQQQHKQEQIQTQTQATITATRSAIINSTEIEIKKTTVANANAISAFALNTDTNLMLMHRGEHRVVRRDAANVPDDEDESSYHDDDFDEYDLLIKNKSAKGKYVGAPCNDMRCDTTLKHVVCDKETLTCGCEKNYPVQIGLIKGCAKPKKLGEQCFYDATCAYNDENSLCVQVRHNAICQCVNGFHSVSYTKPTRRVFCTQDLKELTSDLPTLLGVTTGIAVLAGLICMVLHLFSKTKYPRHRNFGDANLPPPIMYSSDTGLPLTVHSGRPSSRASLRSSGSIGSYGNRRSSSGGVGGGGGGGIAGGVGGGGGGVGGSGSGSKGILVSTSRTGSRRPSLASVHSTSSSVRSYSMMRFEKEAQQKEIRQEMKLRLARLQQQTQLQQNKPQIVIGDTFMMPHSVGGISGISGIAGIGGVGGGGGGVLSRISMATPSPLTPNSLDELLPVVEETQEYIKSEVTHTVANATLNAIRHASASAAATTATATVTANGTSSASVATQQLADAAAYIGPCSSSSEALD